MRNPDVLVVGAGPVGMFAALSMARAGLAVQVIDEQERPAGHSYAVGLHPGSVLLLDQLGVLERVLPFGQRIDSMVLHGGGRGPERRVALDGLVGGRSFGLAVPQARLEEALVGALEDRHVKVRWDHRLADLDPAAEPPAATVERLGREGSGYGYAVNVTVVDRSRVLRPRFVIGADGHRSTVARRLGIVTEPRRPAQTFAAFEVRLGDAVPGDELQILLGQQTVDAIWPLPAGWFRCTFELRDSRIVSPERFKDRAVWSLAAPELTALLARLFAERAPWLPAPLEVGWSAVTRFERRLAPTWGRGTTWLVGDAAHLASPLGSHSLNRGLREADALAASIAAIHGGGAGEAALQAWAERSRAEWDWMFGGQAKSLDPWLAPYAEALLPALPATGDALRELISRTGLVAPSDRVAAAVRVH
jgi:2-polyprenyl-6-methoxyphenol hydroxylase-like FAD-dependent oxidoreductase